MITLNDGTTTITLNPDLYWDDEHKWHPVQQTEQRTVTGALVVSTSTKTGGRPITLRNDDEQSGWMSLSTVQALRNWAAVPGKTMTLTLGGVTRTVIFRHQDGVAVEASPVVHYRDMVSTDWYLVTLRLMET